MRSVFRTCALASSRWHWRSRCCRQAQTPPAAAAAQTAQDKQKPAQEKPERKRRIHRRSLTSSSRRSTKRPSSSVVQGVGEAGERAGDDERGHRPRRSRRRRRRTSRSSSARCPALNITQVSARDINVTTRGSTGTLATGQLALLDGRSLYQDFFGFVMWDLLPVNLNEIKQVEVIRGPASAVWGANAFNGVVNVITKSPREMQGTSAVFGLRRVRSRERRGFRRRSGTSAARTRRRSTTGGRTSFRRAGFRRIRSRGRPASIPCDRADVCGGARASYPGFREPGQHAAEVRRAGRLRLPDGKKLSFTGGIAGTDGIMHSGIGPFDIESGTVMGYVKAAYHVGRSSRGALHEHPQRRRRATCSAIDPIPAVRFRSSSRPTRGTPKSSNLQTFANRHVVSYGGNVRLNFFDLSIAPSSDDRKEFGIFAQDEIFLNNMFRWVVGGRVDRFDYIDDFVFSPRTTFMIKPQENHTFRVSYNRAYRSPSVINNHLDLVIARADRHPSARRRDRTAADRRAHPVSAADQHRRQPGLERAVARFVRDRLLGGREAGRDFRCVLSQLGEERDPVHRGSDGPLHARRIRRRTGRCHRADRLPSRAQLAGPIHVPELRQEHAAGLRAGRQRAGQRLRRRVRQLLVAGGAGSGRTSR